MGKRPNCRSCRHCTPPKGAELGWCQLRQLPIHADLIGELWCHHWTASPPRLPTVEPPGDGGMRENQAYVSHQLSLSGLSNSGFSKDLATT